MSATLISWRAAVSASPTRRAVAYYAGLALAALALVELARGSWAVVVLATAVSAAALWMANTWGVPRTVDGYRMHVARVYDDLYRSAAWTYSPTMHAARLSHELRRLHPPARWRAQHEQLLQLVGESGAARDADHPFRERARRTAARRRGFDATLERFARDQSTPDEERYVASMRALIEQSRTYGRDQLPALAAQLDRALARLRRMRVPAVAAADHAALVQAFGDYVVAVKAVYAAWDVEAPEPDEELLDGADLARGRLETALIPYHRAP